MIVKPCPFCGDEKAQCGCPPYHVSRCRNCGSEVGGEPPVTECMKCFPSAPFATEN